VVESPSFFSAGNPITEFGEIMMVSSPRTNSTRPLRPVRMLSPGFSTSSLPSETGWAPVVVIQTSPDDLLTDHGPSSAASAEVDPTTSVIIRMREN
jgi:hypothetical protein